MIFPKIVFTKFLPMQSHKILFYFSIALILQAKLQEFNYLIIIRKTITLRQFRILASIPHTFLYLISPLICSHSSAPRENLLLRGVH